MKVAIKDILPNPFRRIEYYPIKPGKVAALRASLKKTGFWDNVVARPTANGKVELAYGHHRWRALQDEYGPTHKVELIIRDLPDADMFHIMADENMEEWGSTALIEIETVYSLVNAYAVGRIPLADPDAPEHSLRYAPSFVTGNRVGARQRAYTGETLRKFLNWNETRIQTALSALEQIELGQASEEDFAGLSMREILVTIQETRRRLKEREERAKIEEREAKHAAEQAERAASESERKAAEKRVTHHTKLAQEHRQKGKEESKKVLKQVTKKLRTGEEGYRKVAEIADSVVPLKQRKVDEINRAVKKLTGQVWSLFRKNDALGKKLVALLEFRDSIAPDVRIELITQLDNAAQRAGEFAKAFRETATPIRQAKKQLALE